MTYQEAVDYLYSATPVYQQIGSMAYKPGLDNILALDAHYGHPHRSYATVHVGGTNGKGSTSHTLAAILQAAGYCVGLFTSPHLVDFRERIRVDGEMIDRDYVAHFVEKAKQQVETLSPSFFELTTMLAFCYFRDKQVDYAIIEVGLGGRLDSTNIISPCLSIITNISLDHTQYLGSTLEAIAREKAGIIKPNTPVVVGNSTGEGVREVFERTAIAQGAELYFSEEQDVLRSVMLMDVGYLYTTADFGVVRGELTGLAQEENARTILVSVRVLAKQAQISAEAVAQGFSRVTELTGLLGRWQTLSKHPRLICDTGHNAAGIAQITEQLRRLRYCYQETHIVLGMASDKDVLGVLALLPPWGKYYFTQARVSRALPVDELVKLAATVGLSGASYSTVSAAVEAARQAANESDLIFVGGSNFIVADLLQHLNANNHHLNNKQL